MPKTSQTLTPLGRGIEFAREDDGSIWLKINTDRATGELSASGKTTITAQTIGGWAHIPGTDLKMNLQAGYSNKGENAAAAAAALKGK